MPCTDLYNIPEFEPRSVWHTEKQYSDLKLRIDSINDIFHAIGGGSENLDYVVSALSMLKAAKTPILCLCGSGGEDTFNRDYGFLRYAGYPILSIIIEKKPFMRTNLRKVRSGIPKCEFEDVVLFADYTKRARSLHGGTLWANEAFEKNGKEGKVFLFVDCDSKGIAHFSPRRHMFPNEIYNLMNGEKALWYYSLEHISDMHQGIGVRTARSKKRDNAICRSLVIPNFYTSTYLEVMLQGVGNKTVEELDAELAQTYSVTKTESAGTERPDTSLASGHCAAKRAIDYVRGIKYDNQHHNLDVMLRVMAEKEPKLKEEYDKLRDTLCR